MKTEVAGARGDFPDSLGPVWWSGSGPQKREEGRRVLGGGRWGRAPGSGRADRAEPRLLGLSRSRRVGVELSGGPRPA